MSIDKTRNQSSKTAYSVFSNVRISFGAESLAPESRVPESLQVNTRLKLEGRAFLSELLESSANAAFFDPQFRGVYDKMRYGNEDTSRNAARVKLPQMTEEVIVEFVAEIARVLMPSGHLFLWMDKFHLCSDFQNWFAGTSLAAVDMITWDKCRIGLGYRTRHKSEFCMILQKEPKIAKGVWTARDIPDVWPEKIPTKTHPHNKPVMLQSRLIEAVTAPGDLIIDPAAGSFSVLQACILSDRTFLGCDILG